MAVGAGLAAGVNALRNVTEIPFPEFTAKLIDGVFTAIIAGTIKQMEAYADLIANLAKTVSTFQTENVTDDMVNKFLIDNYPDGKGGTTVRTDYKFLIIPSSPENHPWDQYNSIYNSLIEKIGLSDSDWTELVSGKPTKEADPTDEDKEDFFFKEQEVKKFRQGIARHLAHTMIDQLQAMATQGMARIVIDQVKIYSSMTFKVQTTDIETASKAAVNTERVGAYVHTQVGFVKAWGVKAGATYGSLSVRVANESSFSKVTMDATIIGGMELNGHTDYFPALPASSVSAIQASTALKLEFIVPLEKKASDLVYIIGENITDPTITVGNKSVSELKVISDKAVQIKIPNGVTAGDQAVTVTCGDKSASLTYKCF